MQTVAGKTVFTTLQEIIAPAHTALVLVDFQNDFCHPDGKVPSRLGLDMSLIRQAVERTILVLEGARRTGVLVVFIQNTILPNGVADSPAMLRLRSKGRSLQAPDHCLDGTWGHQIIDELEPRTGELLVKKHRPTAFLNTNLHQILRNNGVKSVTVPGVVSDGCVYATALDALYHDFYSIVLKDCIASLSERRHNNAVEHLEHYVDVITSEQALDAWTNGPSGQTLVRGND